MTESVNEPTDTPSGAPAPDDAGPLNHTGPVVVGVDGSRNSRRAMHVACMLANASGVEVLAVHALGLLATIGDRRVPAADHRDEIEAHLRDEWCAVLQDGLGDRWRPLLVDGNPAEALLHTAVEQDASFIVIGARGLGGHPDLMLGSTSHQVIHHATCPAVVVPPIDRPTPGTVEPAVSAPVQGAGMSKPTVTIPEGDPPRELQVDDHVVGDGAVAMPGATVTVHYVGVSWSSGNQFDASWDRDEPFRFGLGAGQVIAGWDQGVSGMRVGGRRSLTIPPELGYGSRGAGGVIGPDETLVFVVDLLDVS